MTKEYIRIDKGDGSETVATVDQIERVAEEYYYDKEMALDALEHGQRLNTGYAYYEMRSTN